MNICFMADTKHGLALFPGTEEEVKSTIERITRKCQEPIKCLVVAKLGANVTETEIEYMRATHKLPRRVAIRLG